MTSNARKVRLSVKLSDLSPNLISPAPASASEFRSAVQSLASQAVRHLGGEAQVSVAGDTIVVYWQPGAERSKDQNDEIVSLLSSGNYAEGVILAELILSRNPEDVTLLYNLSMALSDLRHLDRAVILLKRAVVLAPGFANAHVALGVAYARMRKLDDAAAALDMALRHDPENAYARRNLGAILEQQGKQSEALAQFKQATELNPSDQAAWLGLARAEEAQGNLEGADAAYIQTIRRGEHTQIANMAREARSRLAQSSFRSAAETVRMDAVMYCLGALERFAGASRAEVQKVTFEIATRGMQGLDVNDSEQKYTLQSLEGKFSGLHLVCIEYVGFKQLDPSLDIGFDLSREFEMANSLFQTKTG